MNPIYQKLKTIIFLVLFSTIKSICANNVEQLRILQLYNNIDYGGTATVKLEMQKLLTRNKLNATTLILQTAKDNNQMMCNQFNALGLPYIKTPNQLARHQGGLKHLIKKHVKFLVKKHKFNVILCHEPDELIALNDLAKSLGVMTCFVVHAFHPNVLNTGSLADAVIVVSPLMLDIMRKKRGHSDMLMHIYPLFDNTPYLGYKSNISRRNFFQENFGISIENDDIVITSIANFYTTSKNHSVLINAFKLLAHRADRFNGQKIHLMLAGRGERMQEMQQLAIDNGLQNQVHFLGFTRQTPELLYHSDIKVLSSDQEGLPIVLMEASLMKKPIIGTAIPGIQGIILDHKTGLLFEKNNYIDLAEKISCFIANSAYAKMLGENAYLYARENYMMPILEQKILAFFDMLTKKIADFKHRQLTNKRGPRAKAHGFSHA